MHIILLVKSLLKVKSLKPELFFLNNLKPELLFFILGSINQGCIHKQRKETKLHFFYYVFIENHERPKLHNIIPLWNNLLRLNK